MAGAPNCGAPEKAGHFGRDDRLKKRQPQEHRQECLCHIERDASGIGDFTEDGWAGGASGGGEVGRAMVEGFVGEEGEGVGFFGLFGDVEVGGRKYVNGIVWKVASGE